jgi:hypothetical protein
MIATEEGSDFRTRNTGLLRAAGRGPWRVVDGPGSARQIIRAALCCAAAAHVPTRRGLPGRGSFFFWLGSPHHVAMGLPGTDHCGIGRKGSQRPGRPHKVPPPTDPRHQGPRSPSSASFPGFLRRKMSCLGVLTVSSSLGFESASLRLVSCKRATS